MLIVTRKPGEQLLIDDIAITVLEAGRHRVRFGIVAPKSVKIYTDLKRVEPSEPIPTKEKPHA